MTNSKESRIMTQKMQDMRMWRMGVDPDEIKPKQGKPKSAKPKGKEPRKS